MLKKLLVCWVYGWLMTCGLAHANSPTESTPDSAFHPRIALAGRMDVLRDPSGVQTLENVRNSDAWLPQKGNFNPGYTSDAIWLRLRLDQPETAPQDWWLEVDSTQIDHVQLYRQTETTWQAEHAGRAVPYRAWPQPTRTPTFRLPLSQGPHVVYLRLQGQHTLTGDIRIWTARTFQEHARTEALGLGIYVGIFIAVLLLQLFFWAMGREANSGWYVVYTMVVMFGTLLGISSPQNLLDISLAAWTSFAGVYLCIVPAVLARLTVVWLDLKHHLPRIGYWYQVIAYGQSVVCGLLVLAGHYQWGVPSSQLFSLLSAPFTLGIAGVLWRRKLGFAGFYILSFGVVDLGVAARYLRNLGVLPVNFYTDHALFIAVAVHLLTMSLYFMHRHNALKQALKIEQRAREEQRDFVGMVSHEFRTPLAVINTSIQQLAANLSAPVEKTLQRCQNIRNATIRLGRLLDDYLSMDRLDTGSQPIQPRPCDFFEVLEEATSDWSIGRIELEIRELPTPWVCDPDMMRVVLRNLLANADRHSPTETPIQLAAQGMEGGGLRITVQDFGQGIAPDEMPRLFQKYFRGRASQGTPGAGLGLYLVQQIVQAHKGTVEVHSALQEGTTFTLLLPRL